MLASTILPVSNSQAKSKDLARCGVLIRVCAWCKDEFPVDRPIAGAGVTHGICAGCRVKFFTQVVAS